VYFRGWFVSAISGDIKCPMLFTLRKWRFTLLLMSPETAAAAAALGELMLLLLLLLLLLLMGYEGEKEDRRCNCL
jgi:hypothetical protein